MSKDFFEGAGLIIGQLLAKGDYYKNIKKAVDNANYSDSKLPEHLRWMLKHSYKIFTEEGVQLFEYRDISKCSVKLICKNALDRKAAYKTTGNKVQQRSIPLKNRTIPNNDQPRMEEVLTYRNNSNTVVEQLIYFWNDVGACRRCNLPEGFMPQVRTLGDNYRPGGVVFMQINPGNIGSTDEKELHGRYRSPVWINKASQKREGAKRIFSLQDEFYRLKTVDSFQELNSDIKKQMKYIWGRSPGEFVGTIERHGVRFEDVCVLNLAQCAIPNDKYTKKMLTTCYDLNTKKLIEILNPKYVVAQGRQVYKFLSKKLDEKFTLIEGVHQSSRVSNAEKDRIFLEVKKIISSAYI